MTQKSHGAKRAPMLRRAYTLAQRRHGHQEWWPGETSFEICVGAILTQNTSWSNVERAIANLKEAGVLKPQRLYDLPKRKLADLIRPAGYFNVKAQRLRAFLYSLVEDFGGDLSSLLSGPTEMVRERLLSISGIGAETADSILLYAGRHPSFVIDAYTKRIFVRHGWCEPQAGYEELKAICEKELNQRPAARRIDYWQDYHAQLVVVGKHYCRPKRPRCQECPLEPLLPTGGPR